MICRCTPGEWFWSQRRKTIFTCVCLHINTTSFFSTAFTQNSVWQPDGLVFGPGFRRFGNSFNNLINPGPAKQDPHDTWLPVQRLLHRDIAPQWPGLHCKRYFALAEIGKQTIAWLNSILGPWYAQDYGAAATPAELKQISSRHKVSLRYSQGLIGEGGLLLLVRSPGRDRHEGIISWKWGQSQSRNTASNRIRGFFINSFHKRIFFHKILFHILRERAVLFQKYGITQN
jgi:hypothetical protein